MNTSALTEPPQMAGLDYSVVSDVASVRSAYTDIGSIRSSLTDAGSVRSAYNDVGSVISAYGTDIADMRTGHTTTSGRHHYIRRSGAGTSTGSHYGPVQHSHSGKFYK